MGLSSKGRRQRLASAVIFHFSQGVSEVYVGSVSHMLSVWHFEENDIRRRREKKSGHDVSLTATTFCEEGILTSSTSID
jgi:hypothetical protein